MSLMRPILNLWLRKTEKPHLARAQDLIKLRHSFERKARFYFRGPRGSRYVREVIAGVPVLNVSVRGVTSETGPLILYLHGGAYVMGSPDTHRAMLAKLSRRCGLPVCMPNYRKAPAYPFPAAPDDALAVYRALMDRPGGVILGGDSAGGGLALALLLDIKRLGLTPPLGCFCLSPLTDLRFSAPSVAKNAEADVVLPFSMVPAMIGMYMPSGDLDDPRASPIRGDFTGCPPVWLTVGDTEILLDDSVRMAERLETQGVNTTLIVERDLPHVWPLLHNLLPEGRATLDNLARWITSLPQGSADS